jgi:UDP:flavonoid glycosyltransferase YjiC (YdhE family)
MRIVLSTWGTTGDVYPFVALSERLVAAGHEIRVCASSIYQNQFAKVGLTFSLLVSLSTLMISTDSWMIWSVLKTLLNRQSESQKTEFWRMLMSGIRAASEEWRVTTSRFVIRLMCLDKRRQSRLAFRG